ncbi:hypothetical protein FZEAL_2788 [Fusarium zealandicum]|uniref:Uncharacterized protein n=1 Tax=Fusarium zealandicum TaxID=1053134 RepID=A0A8H4UQJ0_9HYPO|nr:hypothetical protein FZEAL_2788 [Fusarium zealandicum]
MPECVQVLTVIGSKAANSQQPAPESDVAKKDKGIVLGSPQPEPQAEPLPEPAEQASKEMAAEIRGSRTPLSRDLVYCEAWGPVRGRGEVTNTNMLP